MISPRRRVVEAPPRKEAPKLLTVRVVLEPDPKADVSYLEQEGFEERRRAYKRHAFTFLACRVRAEIELAGTTQALESPGLGGIESDSLEEELLEIVAEEWRQLRDVLKAIGVPTSELPTEVADEWIEWRT